jgi:hypothetical protein
MKSYCKIFGIIAMAAIIGLSIAGCAEDDGSAPASLDGSWHTGAPWNETFTFDTAAGTFKKMSDQGWGERGTFTSNAAEFTTTIIELLDSAESDWRPFDPSRDGNPKGDPTEVRGYILTSDTLLLNGEHLYTKVK